MAVIELRKVFFDFNSPIEHLGCTESVRLDEFVAIGSEDVWAMGQVVSVGERWSKIHFIGWLPEDLVMMSIGDTVLFEEFGA